VIIYNSVSFKLGKDDAARAAYRRDRALPGWGERTRTRRRRFPTTLQVASAGQLNSADVPITSSN
jgi:hypothetical protein